MAALLTVLMTVLAYWGDHDGGNVQAAYCATGSGSGVQAKTFAFVKNVTNLC